MSDLECNSSSDLQGHLLVVQLHFLLQLPPESDLDQPQLCLDRQSAVDLLGVSLLLCSFILEV